MFVHGDKRKSSKKTLNLLLSHLTLSIELIKKISQYVVTYNSTNIIGILSMKRKKKIYLDIMLTKYIKYAIFNKYVVRCMDRFSINPERIIKMAARINRMMLVKKYLNMFGKIMRLDLNTLSMRYTR